MREEEYQRFLDDQTYLLYPLIFQEYLYTLAHVHSFSSNNKLSFLIVKRLITRMYQQKHLILSDNNYKQNQISIYNYNLYYQIISEGFALIGEVAFSPRFVFSLENSEILKVQNLRSILSIFPFLEDQFPYLNYLSGGLLPYPIHLEKVVQTLRYWLKDPSSLHLLRLFLHESWNWNSPFFPKQKSAFFQKRKRIKRNLRFVLFLSNSLVYEYESVFFFLRSQFLHLRSNHFRVLVERIYFYGKVDNFTEVFAKKFIDVFANSFQVTIQLFKDPHMHYVRFKRQFFFALRSTPLIMKKWKYYFVNLFQCHFFVWVQPKKIYIYLLDESSLDFLGYLVNVEFTPSAIRSQMLEHSFLTENTMKKLDTIVPLNPLIKSLTKMKFCNKIGHPLSKPPWADPSDSDLIDRFLCICGDLSQYFSGSSDKKSLSRLKYILRFSCLKTFAHKHKTNIHTLARQLGSDFWEPFFTEEPVVLPFWILQGPSPTHLARELEKLDTDRLWFLNIKWVFGYLNVDI
uniref:Maturase K n=1 Tax=Hypericum ascyron TaxID=210378 RepID=A0A8K1JW48_9ROSI|nr:maturase K [Hypericum ascyron]UCU57586.1 maturase K [Hypericum ascyron]